MAVLMQRESSSFASVCSGVASCPQILLVVNSWFKFLDGAWLCSCCKIKYISTVWLFLFPKANIDGWFLTLSAWHLMQDRRLDLLILFRSFFITILWNLWNALRLWLQSFSYGVRDFLLLTDQSLALWQIGGCAVFSCMQLPDLSLQVYNVQQWSHSGHRHGCGAGCESEDSSFSADVFVMLYFPQDLSAGTIP